MVNLTFGVDYEYEKKIKNTNLDLFESKMMSVLAIEYLKI